MIAPGAEIKAWAITVYGYGTFIEQDEKMVDIKVRHFRESGRQVTVTELGPVAPAPSKPKALLWNELTPGDYWAFHMLPRLAEYYPNPKFAHVSAVPHTGGLLIDHAGDCNLIDETWACYQFVRTHQRPDRSNIDFHSVYDATGCPVPTEGDVQ
jgi:hypothetical protein